MALSIVVRVTPSQDPCAEAHEKDSDQDAVLWLLEDPEVRARLLQL